MADALHLVKCRRAFSAYRNRIRLLRTYSVVCPADCLTLCCRNYSACGFVTPIMHNRTEDDSAYTDRLYMRDMLRDVYAIEFDLNQTQKDEMTFFFAY